MRIFSVIFGILLTICGISCIFTPGETFLSSGYMIAILMLVYGIAGLIGAFSTKKFGLSFVVSIIGTLIGLFALFRPESTLAIDAILIYCTACFFVIHGITSIIVSLKLRKLPMGKMWIWGLLTGILALILGIYSFFHPLVTALAIGFLIGFYFIEAGINMIVLSPFIPEPEEVAEAAEQ